MAGRKVIQDSDDDDEAGDSALSPSRVLLPLSLSTVIDLQSSSPVNVIGQSADQGTASASNDTILLIDSTKAEQRSRSPESRDSRCLYDSPRAYPKTRFPKQISYFSASNLSLIDSLEKRI